MSNIPITAGSGTASVATELIGTVNYQQIKVVDGTPASTNKWVVNSDGSAQVSVIGAVNAVISGSVAAIPTSSTIAVLQSSSIIAVATGSVVALPASPSVITIWTAPSIVGTYVEDNAHAGGQRGLFPMGVRNDTMASVTSADGDYTRITVGPSGETVTANAPLTKWIQGTADLRGSQGGSVVTVAAQGASVFTYITGVQVANMGSASVLVTFGGGLGSILGYTIAPAGGGSNILYPNALKTGENSAFTASISGAASVLVSAQGFTAKI